MTYFTHINFSNIAVMSLQRVSIRKFRKSPQHWTQHGSNVSKRNSHAHGVCWKVRKSIM